MNTEVERFDRERNIRTKITVPRHHGHDNPLVYKRTEFTHREAERYWVDEHGVVTVDVWTVHPEGYSGLYVATLWSASWSVREKQWVPVMTDGTMIVKRHLTDAEVMHYLG